MLLYFPRPPHIFEFTAFMGARPLSMGAQLPLGQIPRSSRRGVSWFTGEGGAVHGVSDLFIIICIIAYSRMFAFFMNEDILMQ
jgi:hypothetical protein